MSPDGPTYRRQAARAAARSDAGKKAYSAGVSFEQMIAQANQLYLVNGRAMIRHMGTKCKHAGGKWIPHVSELDWLGSHKSGQTLAFDTKSIARANKNRLWSPDRRSPTGALQYELMYEWHQFGIPAFYLLEVRDEETIYLLPRDGFDKYASIGLDNCGTCRNFDERWIIDWLSLVETNYNLPRTAQ